MGGPLSGVKVVALEQAVSMPYCSSLLAQMGARVIKVEQPVTGDVVRQWDRVVKGLSSGFVAFNLNKEDMAVDLKSDWGKEVARRLCRWADVFLENFAPGVMERLGLSPQAVLAENPRIIYCSISGYGQDGPYRGVKAYDLLVQGESGLLLTNGYPEAPAKVGVPITDLVAGLHAALQVVSALHLRDRTGQGCYLDVSMFDGAVSWLSYYPHYVWHRGEEPPRTGMRHQYICPYGPYRAKDGRYVNVVVASEEHWRLFCKVVGEEGWLSDVRFKDATARREHRQELEVMVEEAIARDDSESWIRKFVSAGLPCGRVRTIREVLEHPQTIHRRLVVEAKSPVGVVPVIRFPVGMQEDYWVPGLGSHTREVLVELGFSEQEIDEMKAAGAVQEAT